MNTSSFEGYQYYCRIKEDDDSCYTASDEVQLTISRTTWDGSSWDNNSPDIDTIAIVNGNYETTISGSFEACNLIINAGYELNIRNSTYVKIQNNMIVDGTIIVQTQGLLFKLMMLVLLLSMEVVLQKFSKLQQLLILLFLHTITLIGVRQ